MDFDSGVAKLYDFVRTLPYGNSFALLMKQGEEEDSHKVYHRTNQPCYGEMRTYGKETIPEKQSKVIKPGDLHSPFPDGEPVGVALALPNHFEGLDRLVEYIFSPESPWGNTNRQVTLVKDDQGRYIGAVYTDTDFDPTILIHKWLFLKDVSFNQAFFRDLLKIFPDVPLAELLLFSQTLLPYYPDKYQLFWRNDYFLSIRTNVENFVNCRPIMGELTFRQRCAYDRPGLQDIFGVTDSNIMKALTASLSEKFGSPSRFTNDQLPEVHQAFKSVFNV